MSKSKKLFKPFSPIKELNRHNHKVKKSYTFGKSPIEKSINKQVHHAD